MADVWLLDSIASKVSVAEHHTMSFDLGDNPVITWAGARIDVDVKVPLDGHRQFRRDGFARAMAAQEAGGLGRLGVFGLAPAVEFDGSDRANGRQSLSLNAVFATRELDRSGPLHRAGDGSAVTWALDLPKGVDLDPNFRPVGAPEQVCAYRLSLPLLTPALHPLNIQAALAIQGDDLPIELAGLFHPIASRGRNPNNAAARVIAALAQTPSLDSVFQVMLTVDTPAVRENSADRMRLAACSLDWPPGGNGGDVVLACLEGESPSLRAGRYDPATGKVSFPTLSADDEQGFETAGQGQLRLVLRIQNSSVLSAMKPLLGDIDITLDRLASGVRPFLSDVGGAVVAGLGVAKEDAGAPPVEERTVIRASFLIDLRALFRDRPVAQQVRLQFPGRRFSEDQMRQLRTIFKNFQFGDLRDFQFEMTGDAPKQEAKANLLLAGCKRAAGKWQYLAINVMPTRRSVMREVQGHHGTTTETRQDFVDDIAVDLAMVGPDHRTLSALLADLRHSVVSVLGTA